MILTIDGRDFSKILIDNDLELVQNQYISERRTLTTKLITQKLIATNKNNQVFNLSYITGEDLDFLLERNGNHLFCSLINAGSHNFSGTYSLRLPDGISKSYNNTNRINGIRLNKV